MTIDWIRRIDFAFIAICLGPTIVVSGLVFLGYNNYVSFHELRSHIVRVSERDKTWDPLLRDIHTYTEKMALVEKHMIWQESDSAKIIQKEDEILKRQDELCGMINGKKLNELQVKHRIPNVVTEMPGDWYASIRP